MNGTDETAVAALRLFVSCLGAEAGNLALRMIPLAGVYVRGGIALKILPMLNDGVFMSAFVDKGRSFNRSLGDGGAVALQST